MIAIKKDVHNVKNLKNFFQKLKKAINTHNIQKTNMWNINKIEFRIKIKISKIVFFFDKKKKNYIINSNNKNYCTTVKIINIVEVVIFFLLILKVINVLLK